MKTYSVSRVYSTADYVEVEAESEEEAIEKAKELSDDCWEHPQEEFLGYYDYNAEEVK